MKIEYVIISKDEDSELVSPSESFFEDLFSNVTTNSFIFKIEENEKKALYIEQFDGENKLCYLRIEYEEADPIESAKTLMLICDKIESGPHRTNYYFVRTRDEACEQYSEKMYPMIGKFEKRLRELVYQIVLKAYGQEWPEQTNLNIVGNRTEKIEAGLEKFTLTELYTFLFEKKSDKNIENQWDEELKKELIESEEKDELIELIESFRPISLWDKLFSDIKIGGIEESEKEIKEVRDAVSHNRGIKLNKYIEVEEKLDFLIPELEENIEMVKRKTFTPDEQEAIKYRWNMGLEMAQTQMRLSEMIQPLMQNSIREMAQIQMHLSEMIQPLMQNSIREMAQTQMHLSEMIQPLMQNSIRDMAQTQMHLSEMIQPLMQNSIRGMAQTQMHLSEMMRPLMQINMEGTTQFSPYLTEVTLNPAYLTTNKKNIDSNVDPEENEFDDEK
jgi:hypothetical protein